MVENIEKRGLTDRELLQLCLELEKGRCRSIGNTILETSHSKLRTIYSDCLQNAHQNQDALFQMMNDADWYVVDEASSEQIGNVQRLLQHNLHPGDAFDERHIDQ